MPVILSEEETIERALAGYNLSRFGEGEIRVAIGGACKSQERSERLAQTFRDILKSGPSKCLVCLPRVCPEMVNGALWEKQIWPRFPSMINKKTVYGSAFVTRSDVCPWIDTPTYWNRVTDLWRDKDVVLLRGAGARSLMVDSLFAAKSVEEVLAPLRHAFATHYDSLFERLRKERRTVIMCLGSTATALAWSLAQEGVHAVDLGHVGKFMRVWQFGDNS